MFIRKKKNKSGSTSIQLIQKHGRTNKVIKSIGVGWSEREIELLMSIARLELENRLKQPSLFYEQEDILIDSFVASLYNEDITLAGPDLVFGSLFNELGYSEVLDDSEYLKALVVSRVVMPGSKLRTIEYLNRHSKIDVGVHAIYKYLNKLNDVIIARAQQITFSYTKKVLDGKIALVFYDMTTLYFEAEQEDDLRKIGYSKDGKHQHPQIMIGLLVSSNGYPIAYQVFEGNTAETKTLIPAIEHICKQYQIDKPVVVADAALLSNQNITSLEQNGFKYIIGGRAKSEKEHLRQQILDANIQEGSPVEFDTVRGRLIVSFSDKRKKKDEYNRKRGLLKLEKKVATGKLTKENINNRGYNKYLKLEGETIVKIDYEKFGADAKWDGLKGYNTNTNLTSKEVIQAYSNLWVVEKAFRISKTDLKARPIFHRKNQRIKAHICICFMAYMLYKELERRLEVNKTTISIEQAIKEINDILQISYTLPKSKVRKTKLLRLTETKKQILKTTQK
jgi:transposase